MHTRARKSPGSGMFRKPKGGAKGKGGAAKAVETPAEEPETMEQEEQQVEASGDPQVEYEEADTSANGEGVEIIGEDDEPVEPHPDDEYATEGGVDDDMTADGDQEMPDEQEGVPEEGGPEEEGEPAEEGGPEQDAEELQQEGEPDVEEEAGEGEKSQSKEEKPEPTEKEKAKAAAISFSIKMRKWLAGVPFLVPTMAEMARDEAYDAICRSIVMGPVTESDMISDRVQDLLEKCEAYSLSMQRANSGDTSEGFLCMTYYTHEDMEETKTHFEDDVIKVAPVKKVSSFNNRMFIHPFARVFERFKKAFVEGSGKEETKTSDDEDSLFKAPSLTNVVCVTRLPEDVTVEDIRAAFPNAVTIGRPYTIKDKLKCYAYISLPSAEEVASYRMTFITIKDVEYPIFQPKEVLQPKAIRQECQALAKAKRLGKLGTPGWVDKELKIKLMSIVNAIRHYSLIEDFSTTFTEQLKFVEELQATMRKSMKQRRRNRQGGKGTAQEPANAGGATAGGATAASKTADNKNRKRPLNATQASDVASKKKKFDSPRGGRGGARGAARGQMTGRGGRGGGMWTMQQNRGGRGGFNNQSRGSRGYQRGNYMAGMQKYERNYQGGNYGNRNEDFSMSEGSGNPYFRSHNQGSGNFGNQSGNDFGNYNQGGFDNQGIDQYGGGNRGGNNLVGDDITKAVSLLAGLTGMMKGRTKSGSGQSAMGQQSNISGYGGGAERGSHQMESGYGNTMGGTGGGYNSGGRGQHNRRGGGGNDGANILAMLPNTGSRRKRNDSEGSLLRAGGYDPTQQGETESFGGSTIHDFLPQGSGGGARAGNAYGTSSNSFMQGGAGNTGSYNQQQHYGSYGTYGQGNNSATGSYQF